MKKYGILAFPAKHSLSPVIHNAGFQKLGLDSEYKIFEIKESEFADFMIKLKEEDSKIRGLSVSLPYKEKVIEYLDEVDEHAKLIGAVNTIVRKENKLIGTNTDFLGSNEALKKVTGNLNGKRIVNIGAGGASRGIIYGLLTEGAKVEIYNRSIDKAKSLSEEFSEKFGVEIKYGDLDEMKKANDAEVLIQSTSIWTLNRNISKEEIEEFLPMDFLNKFGTVMDIVYKPLMTPLLKRAKELGKKIVTGEKMLLYQAIAQFEIWTNKTSPITEMEAALGNALGQ